MDPPLAHQIKIYRDICGQFNTYHICQIREIILLPGFTGIPQLSIPLEVTPTPAHTLSAPQVATSPSATNSTGYMLEMLADEPSINSAAIQEKEDLEREGEGEEEDREVDDDLYNILALSYDNHIHMPEDT